MRERRNNSSEPKAVCNSKKIAEVYVTLLLIRFHIYLELFIHNCRNIIRLSLGVEQMRGEDGEVLGIVKVKSPISNWVNNVHEKEIACKDIGDHKEGTDERAAKEGSYH